MGNKPVLHPISESKGEKPLGPQQLRFVEEMLIDPSSVTKAAKRAGYSTYTANESGGRLMMDPRVRRAIQVAQDTRAEAIGISKERVLQELAKVAFAQLGEQVKLTDDGDIDMGSLKNTISEVAISATSGRNKSKTTTVKTVKMADKVAALVKLGQHLGMFKEQVEHSGQVGLLELINQSYHEEEVLPVSSD